MPFADGEAVAVLTSGTGRVTLERVDVAAALPHPVQAPASSAASHLHRRGRRQVRSGVPRRPGLVAGTVGISLGVPLELVVLLGVLAFTQEFRYGTVTSTYLGEPRRTRVLVSKWLSLALSSAVITAATLALSVTLAIALVGSRDGDVTIAAQFWQMVTAGLLSLLLDLEGDLAPAWVDPLTTRLLSLHLSLKGDGIASGAEGPRPKLPIGAVVPGAVGDSPRGSLPLFNHEPLPAEPRCTQRHRILPIVDVSRL